MIPLYAAPEFVNNLVPHTTGSAWGNLRPSRVEDGMLGVTPVMIAAVEIAGAMANASRAEGRPFYKLDIPHN